MEQILESVQQFATEAHKGQERKFAPEPFIVHPVRVMQTCVRYTQDPTILSAALLHDVLEDTPVTRNEMFDFLRSVMAPHQAQRTVHLVEQLTDVYIKENYPHWNRKKRKREEIKRLSKISADAQTIKYADVMDNCDAVIHQDEDFADRFLSECRDLLKEINKGNSVLYMRAQEMVRSGLSELKQLRSSRAVPGS